MRILARHIVYLLVSSVAFLLVSCSGGDLPASLRSMPNAYGEINQVSILADQELWDSPVGDTIRYYFSAAYPILPQPEPYFDLRHVTVDDLNGEPIRREMRSFIIIGDLSDTTSLTSRLILKDIGPVRAQEARANPKKVASYVAREKWAKGQVLIYLFAFSKEKLIEAIQRNYPAAAKKINESDRAKLVATLFVGGENRKLMDEVKETLGADIRIPKQFFKAVNNGETMWLRWETPKASRNIMLHKVPYTDQSQLTKAGIKAIRDTLGRKFVSSAIPGSFMRINDVDLPMFANVKTIQNNYALEARGIWELENDYMGGPFVSYLIYNPNKPDLLFVDGFVNAPGEDKRDFLQHLEYLISTIKY